IATRAGILAAPTCIICLGPTRCWGRRSCRCTTSPSTCGSWPASGRPLKRTASPRSGRPALPAGTRAPRITFLHIWESPTGVTIGSPRGTHTKTYTMTYTILWAQNQPAPGGGGGDFQILLLSMMGIFFFAWIFLIRPARRQEQERQQMVSGLQKGDEVLTTSGIYATVLSISDKKDELVLRSEDTKLRVVRAAIHRNFS